MEKAEANNSPKRTATRGGANSAALGYGGGFGQRINAEILDNYEVIKTAKRQVKIQPQEVGKEVADSLRWKKSEVSVRPI